jgi:tetratricopeptide (TPR) repeat protein
MICQGGRLKTKFALLILFAVTSAYTPVAYSKARPQEPTANQINIAQQGLNLLMNGQPDQAMGIFRQVQADDPDSALGYLMEADAVWWKIYFTTGNLIDPDVFEVGSGSTSPYDSDFNNLVNQAIAKARANRNAGKDVARNYLYEGMAYALRGRLAAMRDRNRAAARAAVRMRTLLLAALERDKHLADAYAGLGLYDYFVDTLPTIIKMLRWIIGMPGGNRERGLQEIEYAAKYGELTRGEALFYLAKDYSRSNERQYAKSLELFEQLQKQYPRNGLWTMMVGSLEIRTGRVSEGEALYREVLDQTRGQRTETAVALHKAALKALKARHPGERLE